MGIVSDKLRRHSGKRGRHRKEIRKKWKKDVDRFEGMR